MMIMASVNDGRLAFLKEAASACSTSSLLLICELGARVTGCKLMIFWVASIFTNMRILFLQSNLQSNLVLPKYLMQKTSAYLTPETSRHLSALREISLPFPANTVPFCKQLAPFLWNTSVLYCMWKMFTFSLLIVEISL